MGGESGAEVARLKAVGESEMAKDDGLVEAATKEVRPELDVNHVGNVLSTAISALTSNFSVSFRLACTH